MRVAYSTILSVAFTASALAIPMGKKRHEELEIKTDYTTVVTTIYATVDPPTPSPTPSNPPANPQVKDSYDVYPEWQHGHKSKTHTSPPTAPAPEQPTPPPPAETTPPTTTPVETTPPPPVNPATIPTTTTPPPPPATTPTPPPATTPTPTPTPTTSAAVSPPTDSSFESAVLDAHNQYRARHGAPPLTYDRTMANFAQGVSVTCVFKHSGGPYGENLAAGYPTPEAAVKAWYDENTQYDYDAGQFSSATGHFTQLVWKSTKTMGCGWVSCNGANGTPGYFLTCDYDTGNVIGEFVANVLRPTSS